MTAPTIDDHRRDAVRFPACHCGAVWKQRGNLTGHCTRCHETFDGVNLFDRHQVIQDDGSVRCRDPRGMVLNGQRLEQVGGAWRGPRMPEEVIAARFGSRHAPDAVPLTALAPETAPEAPADGPTDSEASDGPTAPPGDPA